MTTRTYEFGRGRSSKFSLFPIIVSLLAVVCLVFIGIWVYQTFFMAPASTVVPVKLDGNAKGADGVIRTVSASVIGTIGCIVTIQQIWRGDDIVLTTPIRKSSNSPCTPEVVTGLWAWIKDYLRKFYHEEFDAVMDDTLDTDALKLFSPPAP